MDYDTPRIWFWCLVLGVTINGCITTSRNDDLADRIDRLEKAELICHPVEGNPAGDRVCVAP